MVRGYVGGRNYCKFYTSSLEFYFAVINPQSKYDGQQRQIFHLVARNRSNNLYF